MISADAWDTFEWEKFSTEARVIDYETSIRSFFCIGDDFMKNLDQSQIDGLDEVFDQIHQAHMKLYTIWRYQIIYTWQWWFSIGFIVVIWLLWIKLRNKQSTDRLLYAGFLVLVLSSWFDFLGVALGLWAYHTLELPTIPSYLLWDFSVLPVTVMLLLQVKSRISPWMKAIIFGLLTSFVGEPAITWIGLYYPISWRYVYSFPIYAMIYGFAHMASKRKYFDPL
jgi:hypothetical protein